MPVMGGLELLLELRARGYALPVYVMSSGTNHGAEATAFGANGFLPKHLGLDKLPALVTKLWLEGYPAGGRVSEPAARDPAERRPVVVLNSNDDLLVLLAEISESVGFEVVTAHTMEIGREVEAIRDFLRRHNPRVVVYDVSPPYPDNWDLYRKLHDAEVRGGTGRHFVVTTPNKAALEDHVGATSAIELVGDRVDRAAIARAIQQAMLV
jgi:CheY-like chemotaxis protein